MAGMHHVPWERNYTFDQLGCIKFGLGLAVFGLSLDLLLIDADMVWLVPPPELWIRQPALLPADVLLSSDCLDLGADGRGECGDLIP